MIRALLNISDGSAGAKKDGRKWQWSEDDKVAMMLSVFIPDPLSRAVFVAALLVAAFALFRYGQSLEGAAPRLRALLITLRGAALLLVVCVLAGVRVEYETGGEARVLVRQSSDRTAEGAGAALGGEDAQGILDALKKQFFTVVERDETSAGLPIDGGPFVAGVLLTKGAMTADEAASEVERLKMDAGGAPVFVVARGRETRGPAVALESVTVESESVRGVPVGVRCVMHGRGMRGRESLVTIADEAKVQASARVVWTSDDEWQALTLAVVPKTAGWMSYVARVEAAGDEDAGTLARSFSLNVKEHRWRVLFFEGEPTWEAKFIRRALAQSTLFEVDYFAQVSRAAAVGATEDASSPGTGEAEAKDESAGVNDSKRDAAGTPEAKLHAALRSVERLNSYDCVIVGATPDEMLSGAEAARLSEWTQMRGGGLVVLGGNSFSSSIVAPGGKLYNLMPAAIDARGFSSEVQQQSRGVPLEAEKGGERLMLLPTTTGARSALGAYLDTLQSAAQSGGALTGQGLRLGALRPGASVLAVAARGSAPATAATTSETGTPLIAAARYGAGRTLLFAPADSWRLRTTTAGASGGQEESATPYDALWQGLMLWATAGARPPVEITLIDDAPAAGRRLTAEIRARDAATFAPAAIEKLNARLQPLTENAEASADNAQPREVAFVPDENDRSVWRALLDIQAPGQYALEADFIAGGKGGSASKQFEVSAPFSIETGAAYDTLGRAARETGGTLLTGDDPQSLIARLNAASFNPATTRRTWELRTWWPLAFIIPLLLSAAWLVERMKLERGTMSAER